MKDPPESTQSGGTSKRIYLWAILFHYDANDENPFSIVPLNHFKESNFPFELMTGHLGLQDRLKPTTLDKLPGGKYTIFAKIEQGIIYYSIQNISSVVTVNQNN